MSNKPDGLEPRGNSNAFEFGRQWFEMSIKVQKAVMTLVDVPLRTGEMPAHLTQAASAAFGNMYLGLINDPAPLARSQVEFWRRHTELWHNLLSSGDANAEPTSGERRDRRFRNEEWEKNLALKLLMHSYMIGSDWLRSIVDSSDLEPLDRKRVAFFTEQFIDATAPTNSVLTNPD